MTDYTGKNISANTARPEVPRETMLAVRDAGSAGAARHGTARHGTARQAHVDAVACARTRKNFLTPIRKILRTLAALTLPGHFNERAATPP
jgi:hypothetical protein